MKLLILTPSVKRGGVEEYALTIATNAVQAGWDVHIAFPQTPALSGLIQALESQGACYHRLDIYDTKVYAIRVLDYWANFFKTLFLLLKLKPDAVHFALPDVSACFSSIVACGLLKIPTVVVFQLVAERIPIPQLKLKLYAWARSRRQQWVGVSEQNCTLVRAWFQTAPHEVRCIYNGAKTSVSHRTTADLTQLRQRIRVELGLAEDAQIALTVGRLADQKGYDVLIPAIRTISQTFPNVKFVWVGEGERRQALLEQLRQYQVADRVLFLGYRSDVPDLLHASDLFVFPTRFEGQPFALIEAMAQGLPIVTTNVSGIPEMIQNKVHGLLVPPNDSEQLQVALQWALSHPSEMQSMAQNAKVRSQNFSEERMLKDTLGLLAQLCDRNALKKPSDTSSFSSSQM
ncbi:glycosyltransferase family 4 protein [Leptolyngbya boryana CZ1]|uniref:Glycosyltransferase family 4 protein n=1 Tax=Leptolyngbya boryana CZ1 TaxID=3060204 RepID=A0AA97AMA2_LEPBY|nr:glycosyltransferase family 4 protein [Leptolyngbya boryana]WNZ44002.1 glycosyltransferase family 4 protein [Leptolyngbya boryana CZ1]